MFLYVLLAIVMDSCILSVKSNLLLQLSLNLVRYLVLPNLIPPIPFTHSKFSIMLNLKLPITNYVRPLTETYLFEILEQY